MVMPPNASFPRPSCSIAPASSLGVQSNIIAAEKHSLGGQGATYVKEISLISTSS